MNGSLTARRLQFHSNLTNSWLAWSLTSLPLHVPSLSLVPASTFIRTCTKPFQRAESASSYPLKRTRKIALYLTNVPEQVGAGSSKCKGSRRGLSSHWVDQPRLPPNHSFGPFTHQEAGQVAELAYGREQKFTSMKETTPLAAASCWMSLPGFILQYLMWHNCD